MNRPSFALFGFAVLSLLSCATPTQRQASVVEKPKAEEVLTEVARRSGLSESELRHLLENCDLNQQALYFCAFRDFVARDLELQHVRAEKERQLPLCKDQIDRRVTELARARDETCRSTADEESGDGSMNLQTRALCASSTTERLAQRLQGVTTCTDLSRLSEP